ncbi:MAG: hypothetical protein J6U82_02550, partial [Alistipes sp.]|nr:hypothetical protein [Alistipes sp.]
MPFGVSAQSSSINAYSPYSMYGMGEILTPGSAQMRSMGGVGIALRNYGQINPLNPAAASIAPKFDVKTDKLSDKYLILDNHMVIANFGGY